MRWTIGVILICGMVLGYHIHLIVDSIRDHRAQRQQEKAEWRERMGFINLTSEEARAFEQIQRGYKKTAKEDR